ncbi:MAG: hypothetical protein GQ563_06135 [Desulfuromusa sp.]|nr:hypothetical protein [Desulfuromusa sp.]
MRATISLRLVMITLFTLVFVSSAMAADIPKRPSDVQRITIADFQTLQASGKRVVIIDTRTPGQWQRAADKIPGAIRVTSNNELQKLKSEVPPGTEIITYCT